jgi:hypothetical protein
LYTAVECAYEVAHTLAYTVFQHLSLDDGLPQSAVTALLEDGLARWDGYRFHVYRRNGQKAGNNQTCISTLFLDAQRHLWVGAMNGRLARYQPETDTFLTLPVNMGGSVRAFVADGNKGMWVASDGGLHHFSLDGKLLSVLPAQVQQAQPGCLTIRSFQIFDGAEWLVFHADSKPTTLRLSRENSTPISVIGKPWLRYFSA